MNETFLLQEGLNLTKKILDILEAALLEIIKKNDPKHGELTIAKSLLTHEDMSIMIFDTNHGSHADQTMQMHYADAMRKRMMDENNGVGQVCYMTVVLEDGRTAIIFRAQDNDRVALLSRDLKNVRIQGIDTSEFDADKFYERHRKDKNQER